ncbi:hypothetical protein [Bacillus mesophilum]|nr:hypothetical protein [Bacillus mesophilum]
MDEQKRMEMLLSFLSELRYLAEEIPGQFDGQIQRTVEEISDFLLVK